MAHVRQVPTQVQQGDVLLTPLTLTAGQIETIAKNGRDMLDSEGHAVLATGVNGGHPHAVKGEGVRFFETDMSGLPRQQRGDKVTRVVLVSEAGATLTHDEHEHISLIPGSAYMVFRQLETLVGDDNAEPAATGVIANDRSHQIQTRRYVED